MVIIGLDYGPRHLAVAYINTQAKDKTVPTFDIIYRYLVDNNDVDVALKYIKLLTVTNEKTIIVYESIDAYFNPNASKMSGKTIELYALLNDYYSNKGGNYVPLKVTSNITKAWAKTAFFSNFRKRIKARAGLDKLPNNHITDAINMALYGYQQILLKHLTLDEDNILVNEK